MRYSNFLTPVLLLVLSVALFFGFVKKQYAKMGELKGEIVVYEDALRKAELLNAKRDALEKKRSEIGLANVSDLEKILPDSVDTVRLVMDINGIASRYGVLIKSIDINDRSQVSDEPGGRPSLDSETVAMKAYGSIGLSFNVDTTYDKFVSFITDMEESLRIIDITEIEVETTDNAGIYGFKVQAETYWLK